MTTLMAALYVFGVYLLLKEAVKHHLTAQPRSIFYAVLFMIAVWPLSVPYHFLKKGPAPK